MSTRSLIRLLAAVIGSLALVLGTTAAPGMAAGPTKSGFVGPSAGFWCDDLRLNTDDPDLDFSQTLQGASVVMKQAKGQVQTTVTISKGTPDSAYWVYVYTATNDTDAECIWADTTVYLNSRGSGRETLTTPLGNSRVLLIHSITTGTWVSEPMFVAPTG